MNESLHMKYIIYMQREKERKYSLANKKIIIKTHYLIGSYNISTVYIARYGRKGIFVDLSSRREEEERLRKKRND